MSARYERIESHDGKGFDAYCAVPATVPAPGILLFQEVFGVNDNMRGLADQLAGHGYLALVPDMFWRLRPRFESKDESGLAEGMGLSQQLDHALAAEDITSTFAHLLEMPECDGAVGGVGFCLGGTLAYLFARESRVDGRGPDAVVSYYGSAITDVAAGSAKIDCPVLFHYGANDPYIPQSQVDEVEAAFAGRSDVSVLRYDAGHAFSNWDAPSFYDKPSADLAWGRTLEFFARHLTCA
ncbi:dienelactone hydrolase family protein [Allokutzneria multivorans]|uniref:Dienelactone hydrolase family protein n=1 Tax=Allokutzneria multivorans TaxID=1142134 RepID=A0ABP7QV86_9PSEU